MAHFIDNKQMLIEVVESKKRGQPTAALADMFILLVDRYSTLKNWAGYSYLDEMCASARVNLCAKWQLFDETKYDKPFAYYTKIVHTCFIGELHKQKREQRIKDDLLIDMGYAPSFSRQAENSEEQSSLASKKKSKR